MSEPSCPGCHARDAVIADLQRQVADLAARVRDLEARLNCKASNSSLPPSANPPQAPPPVVKKKSKRPRGGQPGHPPHLRHLLPAERVNDVQTFVPQHCEHCQAALPAQPSLQDPAPTRFQTIELPAVVAQVTEYQGHARTCPVCGQVTRAAVPREILQHSVGPRLTATLSYFAGCHGVSKRGVEEIAAAVFDAPVSLGTVIRLEQEVSVALAASDQEALSAVQQAAVKHGDETSWKLAGRLCWLWAAATAGVVAFVIHARRSTAGLTALLEAEIHGILCIDRWGVYNRVPVTQRQICWAHLKRDFQKIVDRGGPNVSVGQRGRQIAKKVFAAWHAFQAGPGTREQLEAQLDPVANRLQRVLLEGAILGTDPTVVTFCENLLAVEPALWTFVRTEGVEPTNNFISKFPRPSAPKSRRSKPSSDYKLHKVQPPVSPPGAV
jgi:transposase